MAKKKVECKMDSFGRYTRWERGGKELPELLEYRDRLKGEIDMEFGMILQIRNAKGKKIEFCIKHPPFRDDKGNVTPDFEGYEYATRNDYTFFIGDSIWEPLHDKLGTWEIIVWLEGNELARKKIEIE